MLARRRALVLAAPMSKCVASDGAASTIGAAVDQVTSRLSTGVGRGALRLGLDAVDRGAGSTVATRDGAMIIISGVLQRR